MQNSFWQGEQTVMSVLMSSVKFPDDLWSPLILNFYSVNIFGVRLSTTNRPHITFVQNRKRHPFLQHVHLSEICHNMVIVLWIRQLFAIYWKNISAQILLCLGFESPVHTRLHTCHPWAARELHTMNSERESHYPAQVVCVITHWFKLGSLHFSFNFHQKYLTSDSGVYRLVKF